MSAKTPQTPRYFVNHGGDDKHGTGSQNKPWQTIHHALLSIPLEEDNATLFIGEGNYKIATTLLFSAARGGSDGKVFTVAAHENEEVIIDGSLLIEQFAAMVKISSASYIKLQGLIFENLSGNKSAILIDGDSQNITVADNVMRQMSWIDSADQDKYNPSPSNNLNPIAVVGTHPERPIKNIEISGNELYDIVPGYSEGIKVVGNVTDFAVANNHVHDIANIGIVAAGNYSWVTDSSGKRIPDEVNQARNGVINNNVVHNAVSPIANSAGIYLDGARNVVVSDNTSHNNSVGFSVGCEQPGTASGNTLTKNVAYDNKDAGLVIGTNHPAAQVKDTEVSHNEFHTNYCKGGYGGEMTIQKASHLNIHHNTFASRSDVMTVVSQPAAGLDLNNNQYYGASKSPYSAVFDWGGISGVSYSSFHEYQAKTKQDADSIYKKVKPRNANNKAGFATTGLNKLLRIFNGGPK